MIRTWRRRKQTPAPVVLPSLDRLAGLIERVVELVDEVSAGSSEAPAPSRPERQPEPAPERAPEPVAAPVAEADGRGWLAFVLSPQGYTLLPRDGAAPEPGEVVELDGTAFRVLRHGAVAAAGRRTPLRVPREGGTAGGGSNHRPVKEESQIDDMRAALQGDRERAEQARQRSTENVLGRCRGRQPEPEPDRRAASRSRAGPSEPPARPLALR